MFGSIKNKQINRGLFLFHYVKKTTQYPHLKSSRPESSTIEVLEYLYRYGFQIITGPSTLKIKILPTGIWLRKLFLARKKKCILWLKKTIFTKKVQDIIHTNYKRNETRQLLWVSLRLEYQKNLMRFISSVKIWKDGRMEGFTMC